MLIIYRPERENPERRGSRVIDGLTLDPGTNTVDDDLVKAVADTDTYKQLLEWGAVSVHQPTETVAPVSSTAELGGLNIESAQEVIEATNDVPTLEGWLKVETRKTVINAINRRITEIKEGRI